MIVRAQAIDMAIWQHLTNPQRDELRDIVRLVGGPEWFVRIEHHDTPSDAPMLRITARVKERRRGGYVTLLDPSCMCGPGGRAVHLWELISDRPLIERLPTWWQPRNRHVHETHEATDYDDLANGRRSYICGTCPARGTASLDECAAIEWSNE